MNDLFPTPAYRRRHRYTVTTKSGEVVLDIFEAKKVTDWPRIAAQLQAAVERITLEWQREDA